MKKLHIVTAAVALAIAGAAFAQAPAGTPSQMNPVHRMTPNTQFSSMDTNKDGRISREEAKAHAGMTSSGESLDADKDMYLSEAEYSKYKAPGAGAAGSKAPPSNTSPPSAAGNKY